MSVENQAAISTVLRKARGRGIKVLTWDADAEPDARDFLINQATPQGIGETLTDEAARLLGGTGEFAIITGVAQRREPEPVDRGHQVAAGGEVSGLAPGRRSGRATATATARSRRRRRSSRSIPTVKLIMGIAAPAVPGAAEAVRQSGRKDVVVTGLSLPNMCKPYVHDGIIKSVVLWNTRDLGYLTVRAAGALARGELTKGQSAVCCRAGSDR